MKNESFQNIKSREFRNTNAQLLFRNEDHFAQFKRAWSTAVEYARNNKGHTKYGNQLSYLNSSHHLLYLLLAGKNWAKAFPQPKNMKHIQHGELPLNNVFQAMQELLHIAKFASDSSYATSSRTKQRVERFLEPFDGTVTHEMVVAAVSNLQPVHPIYPPNSVKIFALIDKKKNEPKSHIFPDEVMEEFESWSIHTQMQNKYLAQQQIRMLNQLGNNVFERVVGNEDSKGLMPQEADVMSFSYRPMHYDIFGSKKDRDQAAYVEHHKTVNDAASFLAALEAKEITKYMNGFDRKIPTTLSYNHVLVAKDERSGELKHIHLNNYEDDQNIPMEVRRIAQRFRQLVDKYRNIAFQRDEAQHATELIKNSNHLWKNIKDAIKRLK